MANQKMSVLCSSSIIDDAGGSGSKTASPPALLLISFFSSNGIICAIGTLSCLPARHCSHYLGHKELSYYLPSLFSLMPYIDPIEQALKQTPVVHFVVKSISDVQYAKNGSQYRKTEISLPATGKTGTITWFDRTFAFDFGRPIIDDVDDLVGKDMEAYTNAKGFKAFRIVNHQTATQNNMQQVKGERVATKEFTDADDKRDLKDIEISLQGLVQAYIIQGKADPLGDAEKMRERIKAKAKEIHTGIPSVPEKVVMPDEVDDFYRE